MAGMTLLARYAALVCCIILPTLHAHAADACQYVQVAKVPVQYMGPSLEIVVDGRINGKPAKMLVDTGAYSIMLTRAGAEALQLDLKETSAYAIGVGGRSKIHVADLDDFAIGPAKSAKGQARVLDEMGSRHPYQAIAGVPYLMQMDLEVALADKEIKFFHAKGCNDAFLAYWDRHAVVIPYRLNGAPYPVFSIEINGDLMRAIIDTGATTSAIMASAARKFGLVKGKPEAGQLRYTTGVGTRQVPTWTVHTKSIKIGGETILDADIQVIDDRNESAFDVCLGADFLRAHRVLFAISQQNIYLSYLGGEVFTPHTTIEPWVRKEADEGNPDAQMRLALSYLSGKGTARDDAQAQAWIDKAAALNHLDANLFDGYRKLTAGRFADAAPRLQAALARLDDGRYEALALYQARVGAGQQTAGADELAARFARFDTQAWPGPVAEFFLGRIDRARLETLASTDAKSARTQRCEALDLMAGLHRAQGDLSAADALKATWNDACAPSP
jgi:predicted aspartyl protease